MKKKRSVYLIFIALFVLIFVYGCEDPLETSKEPAIFVEICRYKDDGLSGTNLKMNSVQAFIAGAPGDPIVTINDDTLTEGRIWWIGELVPSWGISFSGNIPIDPEEEYELIVSHDSGEAYAQITMPSYSEIITPNNNDTFNLNEDIVVNWTSSENMERYILNIEIHSFDSLVNTTDTSITIPTENISLPGSDTIKYRSGSIHLKSENGPSIRRPLDTTERNISGYGIGYFVATNYAESSTNITVETDTLGSGGYDKVPFTGLPFLDYPIGFGYEFPYSCAFRGKLNILSSQDPRFRQIWDYNNPNNIYPHKIYINK